MLAVVAAIVFGLALLFDLAEVSSDAFNFETLVTVGLLLLALHMAGFGGTSWRGGGNWGSRRRRR